MCGGWGSGKDNPELMISPTAGNLSLYILAPGGEGNKGGSEISYPHPNPPIHRGKAVKGGKINC